METIYEVVRIKQEVREIEGVETVRSPQDVAKLAFDFIGEDDREVFLVMCLNTKNNVIAVHKAHIGSINASIVHPREIMKTAILNNAASLILSHNHPSANPNPSPQDIEVTERLVEAGNIMGIEILDHLIVTPIENKYLSMKGKGYF